MLEILRKSQAVSYALSFFWLDGFAVPALVVELVVEPVETLSRHSVGLCPERVYPLKRTMSQTVGHQTAIVSAINK
jgi:hypothetical protein